MAVIEQQLAEAIVYYEKEQYDGVETVDIQWHINALKKWLDREQNHRHGTTDG